MPNERAKKPTSVAYATHEATYGTAASKFEPTTRRVLPSATRADLGVSTELTINGRPWVPRRAVQRRRVMKKIKRSIRAINEAAWAERVLAEGTA